MEKKEESPKKGLTDEDLGLALVDTIMLGPPKESKSLDGKLIYTVEYQGKVFKLAVANKEALESLKRHGYKDGNGKIHLRVPQYLLKENGLGWIDKPF